MAITSSAKKALRQSFRKRVMNVAKKDKIKKLLKEFKLFISQKKTEEAKQLLSKIYKSLDKAAKSGVIKKNAASRKKSRIASLVSKTK
ncbi:MAG: 30S ribosomal protein S20 [Patescibacteria group bacterium]